MEVLQIRNISFGEFAADIMGVTELSLVRALGKKEEGIDEVSPDSGALPRVEYNLTDAITSNVDRWFDNDQAA